MSISTSDAGVRYERLRALTLGRAAAAIGLVALLGGPGRALVDDRGWPLLVTAAVVHLVVQLAVLLGVPRRDALQRIAAEVTLVVDVAVLAIVLTLTGGTSSPLAPLLLVEVIAVTLLFGRWGGLRVSLLLTVAVVWVLFTDPPSLRLAIDAVRDTDRSVATALLPDLRAVVLLTVLWATTLITGWLSDVTARDLQRRTEDLTVLREITPDLDPRQGPERVAEALAGVIVDRLRYPAGAVWLPDQDRFRLAGVHGGRHHPSIGPDSRDLDPDADDRVIPLLTLEDVFPVRRDDPRPAALADLFGRRAPLALAPLRADGRNVGLLAVEIPTRLGRGPALRVRDVRLLQMLAEQAGLLVDNARLQSELADLAVTDAVTGLPNHRFLQQRLAEELERVARRAEQGDRRAMSFALFDLDHFKRVNDTYGHPTGDRVLAAVAGAAARTLRGTDVVCRYGGEEFAIVLVDTDADSARLACERVRSAVRELSVEAFDGRRLEPITASFGITTVVAEVADRSALVERADEALYAAKRGGRDRVVHAEDVADLVTSE